MNLCQLLFDKQIKYKSKLNFISYQVNSKLINEKICHEDHEYNYAPHVHNGRCRFCDGYPKDINYKILLDTLKSHHK